MENLPFPYFIFKLLCSSSTEPIIPYSLDTVSIDRKVEVVIVYFFSTLSCIISSWPYLSTEGGQGGKALNKDLVFLVSIGSRCPAFSISDRLS